MKYTSLRGADTKFKLVQGLKATKQSVTLKHVNTRK